MKSLVCAAAAAATFALCAPAYASPRDMAEQMDADAPHYGTPECQEVRDFALGHYTPTTVNVPITVYHPRGPALPPGAAYAAGGIALLLIIGAATEEARRDEIVAKLLVQRCGEDALIPYFTAKATKGDDEAAVHLAHAYAQKQDWPQALHWYQAAADGKNADAQLALGSMYAEGKGVAQDRAQAVAWWGKAAEQHSREANRRLGEMYAQDQNYAKAIEYYQEGGRYGDGPSAFALAGMYEQGSGVARNDFAAFGWYSIATLAQFPNAEAKRAAVAARLTPAQLADEIRNVDHCYLKHSCRF